jgi:hypothetical protein
MFLLDIDIDDSYFFNNACCSGYEYLRAMAMEIVTM